MALLESAAVARGIRKPGEPQIDSNRELLATGAANVVGVVLPGAARRPGGFSQSAVNQGAGARTQLASIVTVVLALLVVIFLAPVLSLLPQATLAVARVRRGARAHRHRLARAVLPHQSHGLLDRASRLRSIGLTVGLLAAVAVGVVSTLVAVLRELNRLRVDVGEPVDGVLPIRLLGPLYTANVLANENAVLRRREAHPGIRAVALELTPDVGRRR